MAVAGVVTRSRAHPYSSQLVLGRLSIGQDRIKHQIISQDIKVFRLITSERVTTLPVLRQELGRLVYLSRTDDAPSTPSVWHNFLNEI